MCPYLVYSEIQSLCGNYPGGLMCPSLQERQGYCFGNYKNCHHYSIIEEQIKDDAGIRAGAGKL